MWSPPCSPLCSWMIILGAGWPAVLPSEPDSQGHQAEQKPQSVSQGGEGGGTRKVGLVIIFMGEFLLSTQWDRGRKGHRSWAQRGPCDVGRPHLTIAESMAQPGTGGTAARAENQVSLEELKESDEARVLPV